MALDWRGGSSCGRGRPGLMLRGMSSELAKPFIARWAAATASERANSQPFLCELCDVVGVARSHPPPPVISAGPSYGLAGLTVKRRGQACGCRIELRPAPSCSQCCVAPARDGFAPQPCEQHWKLYQWQGGGR